MHTKARSSEYPGTNVKRFPVPSEFVDWKVPFREYKPMDYTSEKVLQNPPWADPDIRLESLKLIYTYAIVFTARTGMGAHVGVQWLVWWTSDLKVDGLRPGSCHCVVYLGCILLGLFWLFLFRFRNNRIHGISILKRTPILETEYPWRR